MKKCNDIQELAPLGVTQDLDPAEQAAFDSHLLACPSCTADAENLKIIYHQVQVPPADPGEIFFQRQYREVMAQLDQMAPQVTPSRRPARAWLWPLAAAAVITALVFGVGRISRWQSGVPVQELATNFQELALEAETGPGSPADLDDLDSVQLGQLATRMENKLLMEEVEGWDQDGMDLEDLNDSELNSLIQRLQGPNGRTS